MTDDTWENPDYAWNYQMNGAFITDRTLHLVREVDGLYVTAKCGAEFQAERHQRGRFDETPIRETQERHRCLRCPWDEAEH